MGASSCALCVGTYNCTEEGATATIALSVVNGGCEYQDTSDDQISGSLDLPGCVGSTTLGDNGFVLTPGTGGALSGCQTQSGVKVCVTCTPTVEATP
jgi:hypothetical protein